jgi:hypothetical protein
VSLAEIIAEHESREQTLTVLNRDEPEPIRRMLRRMVDAPDVEVRDAEPAEDGPGNVVVLETEDGPRVGISTIEEVANSVLMVNADLYITGTRRIEEVDTPDVLAGLAETTFTVSGKQKMLLIELSRHVESLAYRHGDGTVHSGFQRLSRLDDERGTREVYESLVERGVDAHVYGVGDPTAATFPAGITVHAGDGEELRRSWIVVSTDCPADRKAALLAQEAVRNEWTGFWTFEESMVDRVDRYLRERYWP